MSVGVRLQLFDASSTPRANLTGIEAQWWDETDPANRAQAHGYAYGLTTDNDGYITLNLDGVTELTAGQQGFLSLYKEDEADTTLSPAFQGVVTTSTVTGGTYAYSDRIDPLEPWVRPADWLTMPTVLATDQLFVGLHAVFATPTFLALSAAGDYTVEWGDGTTENFASGVTAEHIYDYSTYDVAGATLSSRGYKQVLVKVYPQAGQTLTELNLQKQHSTIPSKVYSSGFLDIKVAGSSIAILYLGSSSLAYATQQVKHPMLERFEQVGTWNVTYFTAMFYACSALKRIPSLDTTGAVSFDYMFYLCRSLEEIPPLDVSSVTNAVSLFRGCTSLRFVPHMPDLAVPYMGYMFEECIALRALPYMNTSLAIDAWAIFSGCRSVRRVPKYDWSALEYAYYMFEDCSSLEHVPTLNMPLVADATSMFMNCKALRVAPELYFGNTVMAPYLAYLFDGCNSLEEVPLLYAPLTWMFDYAFRGCTSLRKIGPITVALEGAEYTFSGCSTLEEAPPLNFVNGGSVEYMFSQCASLKRVPAYSLPNVYDTAYMFQSCASLVDAPAIDLSTASSVANIFSGCSALRSVPAFNTPQVAASAGSTTPFSSCLSLASLNITNYVFNLDLRNCNFSGAALDAVYTSLPTVTGRTIYVKGNYGIATHTPSIATAKGWTVSTA